MHDRVLTHITPKCKGKVVHVMKAEVKLHSFVTSKLVGGKYEDPCPTYIMSGERTPGTSGVLRNFVRGGSTNSVEDSGQRERGSGGSSPLVRGSGGSCNLVQEISFHIVKIFLIFGTLDYLC